MNAPDGGSRPPEGHVEPIRPADCRSRLSRCSFSSLPVVMVFFRTFENGLAPGLDALQDPRPARAASPWSSRYRRAAQHLFGVSASCSGASRVPRQGVPHALIDVRSPSHRSSSGSR